MPRASATSPKIVCVSGETGCYSGRWSVDHSSLSSSLSLEGGAYVPRAGCGPFCCGPWSVGSVGEQRLVGQSCSGAWLGEQVPGSPEKGGGEVWREEPTRASWAGQEGGRVVEGIPGGERGCAKVQPARPGELDLDKDPGRCESLEPLSGPLASRDRGRTQHKQGFRGPL